MIRTTPEAVAAIIEVDTDIDLIPFIDTAAALVAVIVKRAKPSLSEDLLEKIERYLSAHMYTLRDPRATKEKAGPVEQTNQSAVDLFLSTSHYGQMAQILDISGVLRSLSKGQVRGKVVWLGTAC